MSVEKEINKLLEQAQEMENTHDELSLTEEDLELLSQEEIDALVENIDQLDELSKKTLASYVGKANADRNAMNDTPVYTSKDMSIKKKYIDKRSRGIDKAAIKIADKLTKEDLDEMSQEDFDALVENFDQLDEVSKATLAQYVGSVTNLTDTEVAATETKKAKGKIDSKDSNENMNSAKVATGQESKDFNIKKDVGFEKGDQTVAMESIDLGNLFEGHDLTEEFKTKATTIFESAVATRVADELAVREKELAEAVSEEMDELTEGLIDKVDGFLSYVAEQWLQKNELALDRGIKADLFESFVSGMKNLFEEHYINVPEEQFDVLENLQTEKEELESKLNETTEHNIALANTLKEISKNMQIEEALEGLSDVQAEKFAKLAENIVFENEDSFAEKLEVIRENYFSTPEVKVNTTKQVFMSDSPVESLTEEVVSVHVDPTVAAYAKRIK